MKKGSTVATRQSRNCSEQKLTIGLDLGDRSSGYCGLDESGPGTTGAACEHDRQGSARRVWRNAGQPCRAGNGDALAVGESAVDGTGARSDRGACTQRAADRGESKERRSAGCADVGKTDADRSAVAMSGEAPEQFKRVRKPFSDKSTLSWFRLD